MKTLLSLSLLHIVSCIVYNVIPDDHNTACNHCYTLQYYQLNISKYFTSNTQLLFLPGLHHLHTDLIIQNVHNISLVGNSANDTTPDTVIRCDELVSIIHYNITNLTMKNLMIQNGLPVIIRDCKNVLMDYLQIYTMKIKFYSLTAINILGKSHLSHILCHNIHLHYNETEVEKENSTLMIDHCLTQMPYHSRDLKEYSIVLSMEQISYSVTVKLSNTTVDHKRNLFILIEYMSHAGVLIITFCQFRFNYDGLILSANVNTLTFSGIIYISDSQFLHNIIPSSLFMITGITMHITECNFYNNSIILITYAKNYIENTIVMRNTFLSNTYFNCESYTFGDFIELSHTVLTLTGTVIFNNIVCRNSIISLRGLSTININGSIKFSSSHVNELINFDYNANQFMMIEQHTVIEITQNEVCNFFKIDTLALLFSYPFCLFQYTERFEISYAHKRYSIMFDYNKYTQTQPNCATGIPITKCL